MHIKDKQFLFNKLNRLYDQVENNLIDCNMPSSLSISSLMKEAGYPETEIEGIQENLLKLQEGLEDILPGLQMQIDDERQTK